jgi:hypothetical protein
MSSYSNEEFKYHFQLDPIKFFKGEDGFLARDPDWGVHMYFFGMKVMFRYIDANDISITDFVNGFKIFIDSLEKNESDFKHFESNICAFYQCMIDDGENIHDLFSVGAECREASERYIKKITYDYKDDHYYKTVMSDFPQAAINEIW